MASPSPAAKKALTDANLRWPGRNRASDGLLPSAEHHKQNPKSDHETGNAVDITLDVEHGVNCEKMAVDLITSGDKRIKYIIWNKRIWYPVNGKRPRGWSPYNGKNPHTKHIHISIKPEFRDDVSNWPWGPPPTDKPLDLPVLRLTFPIVKREAVKKLQERLKFHGAHINPDGMFGLLTRRAVVEFQRSKGIGDDGIVGPFTWKALLAN